MKKLVATLIATGMLVGMGTVLGQAADHQVEIRIPNVLMLRITDGTGNDAVTTARVDFDFQAAANVDTYLNMVNAGGGLLVPTSVTTFGDVIVFSNRAAWRVTVGATGLLFNPNVVAGLSGAGVALSDIRVVRSGTVGANVSAVNASWDLTGGQIANGVQTRGWRSLGFSGGDYRLDVNGDEDPGTYTTTVTYTIVAP